MLITPSRNLINLQPAIWCRRFRGKTNLRNNMPVKTAGSDWQVCKPSQRQKMSGISRFVPDETGNWRRQREYRQATNNKWLNAKPWTCSRRARHNAPIWFTGWNYTRRPRDVVSIYMCCHSLAVIFILILPFNPSGNNVEQQTTTTNTGGAKRSSIHPLQFRSDESHLAQDRWRQRRKPLLISYGYIFVCGAISVIDMEPLRVKLQNAEGLMSRFARYHRVCVCTRYLARLMVLISVTRVARLPHDLIMFGVSNFAGTCGARQSHLGHDSVIAHARELPQSGTDAEISH